jgi:integrase
VGHLVAYQHRRDQLCPQPATTAFFLSCTGTRLNSVSTHKAFTRVLAGARITVGDGTARPRLYDLRHTFAVTTLTNWYAAGADVGHLLPALSTYLGHISPATTYWYLHACPQLMTEAVTRLEASWRNPS